MNQRPISITVIGWLFMVVGGVGIVYHAGELKTLAPLDYEVIAVLLIRLAAVLFGAFLLRGADWSRWGLLVWMAYHVGLSAFHNLTELIVHGALLGVIAYFVLRPQASAYFCGPRAESPSTTESTQS